MTIKQDFIMTLVNGLVVMIGIFLLNGYVARHHGLETLGHYLLVRRTSYAVVGVLLLGMNVGLPNFVAKDQKESFGDSAIVILFTFTLPVLLLLTYFVSSGFISGFLPDLSWTYFAFALAVCIQSITYGLYRGHLRMVGANLIHLISTAVIPFVAFIILDKVDVIFRIIAICVTVVASASYLVRNHGFNPLRVKLKVLKRLALYGFKRIPSFASQFILLAGVPLLVMSHVSFSDISYLNSTISLVRIFLVFVGPLGIILLPRISQALAQGKVDQVKRGIEMLLMWVLFGGLLMSFSLSLFGPEILKLWLGNVSVNGAWTARVLLIALPFYAIVGVLRSPIDAASERGYNSIIYSLAAVLLLISFFLMKSAGISVLKAGVISFLIGYITAAIFSLLIVYKLLNVQPFNMSLLIHMIAGCLLVVVGNYIVIRTHLQHSMQIVVFFLAFLILFLIFVLKSRREWVIEFRKQALGQNKVN